MLKYATAIMGFYAIVKYVVWCNLSYTLFEIDNSFAVPQSYNDITNLVIYAAITLAFISIGKSTVDLIDRIFIFYAIAEFWGFLCLQIAINLIFPDAIIFRMYVVALLSILIINFVLAIYYLILWYLKSR